VRRHTPGPLSAPPYLIGLIGTPSPSADADAPGSRALAHKPRELLVGEPTASHHFLGFGGHHIVLASTAV